MKVGDQIMLKLEGKSKRPYRIVDIAAKRVIVQDMETWAQWTIPPKLLVA